MYGTVCEEAGLLNRLSTATVIGGSTLPMVGMLPMYQEGTGLPDSNGNTHVVYLVWSLCPSHHSCCMLDARARKELLVMLASHFESKLDRCNSTWAALWVFE